MLTVYPEEGGKFSPEIQAEFTQNEDIGINISNQGAYYNELKHFVNCVENDLPVTIAPLAEAVKSLQLDIKEIEQSGGVKK